MTISRRRLGALAAPWILAPRLADAGLPFPTTLFGGTCTEDTGANTLSKCKRSAYVGLSGGNLTASTAIVQTSLNSGIRGIQGRSTGKLYFEFTAGSAGSATPLQFGLCTSAVTFTTLTGAVDACFIQNNGALMDVRCNGSSFGLAGSFCGLAAGGIIGVAVDLDARLAWLKSYDSTGAAVGKQWNVDLNGDPVLGTGGIDLSTLSSATLYPFLGERGGLGGGAVGTMGTFNPTSSVVHAAPVGFTAGW